MLDYLIVGAGLYGATVAWKLKQKNKSILVVDERDHIGGNCYTEYKNGIYVHKYGPHIFHTNNKEIWDFVNKFDEFEDYVYSPLALAADCRFYNLPFNMNTFYQLYGIIDANTVKNFSKYVEEINNLENLAIASVGEHGYNMLVKNYTEKMWGRPCSELPISILKRIPVRLDWNNNYFDDKYQGIPKHGYTCIIEKLLEGVEIKLNTKYNNNIPAKNIIYTGSIDELHNYKYGKLEYRSLIIDDSVYSYLDTRMAVINDCTKNKITRTVEHKYFLNSTKDLPNTIITTETPVEWQEGMIRYYPIPTKNNIELYNKYLLETNLHIGGRLGEYKYLNMDQVIEKALQYE